MAKCIGNPGYGLYAEYNGTRLFDGPGYIGFDGSSEQNAGRFFITGDISRYFEEKTRSGLNGMAVPDEAVSKYVADKVIRFSKMNTVFGRVIDEDREKLTLLKDGTVIEKVSIIK